MKFGKQIQAEQVLGWSQYYLDYKFLKKIISSLTGKRPPAEAASLALGVRPGDLFNPSTSSPKQPPWRSPNAFDTFSATDPQILVNQNSDDKDPEFSAYKAAFFFKLERELEKINAFYLRKEADYKHRLETLLAQRRAAVIRVLPDGNDDSVQDHIEWTVVAEGFKQLERDLSKLQHFVELNATGFRKILKKWDKRSKSTTKELYLARQVDVQPVFNRQLISEYADTVAACLLDITDLSTGLNVEKPGVNDLIFSHQIVTERSSHAGPFHALEGDLRKAVLAADEGAIRDIIKYSDTLASQQWGSTNVNRIIWKAVIDAPADLADLILSCPAKPFDFLFIDDVSGRTCLHEAVMANAPRLVDICLSKEVDRLKLDVYGRSPVHYSCLSPSEPGSAADQTSAAICLALLNAGLPADVRDLDNYSPLLYAILRGSVERVRVLLDHAKVSVAGTSSNGDLNPLSLACQSGHLGVVTLLLERGATGVPNTNGEYPMHIAAREGHVEICRLFLGRDGWDTPDKYNDWTPIFHAARHGRDDCLKALLDSGARVTALDEFGNAAVYYAAWFGHRHCVQLLLDIMGPTIPSVPTKTFTQISPLALSQPAAPVSMDDLELIPSLALPPPAMPYRVYGHNFLDKTSLIQIILGPHPGGSLRDDTDAIRLHPRLSGIQSRDRYTHASPFLKLVISAGSDATSAPHSVGLPLSKGVHMYTFQVSSLDRLSLEFTLYPHYGTKTVGRAVDLPASTVTNAHSHPRTLPILDSRLHVIGEITYMLKVIKPFTGVTLEIGGGVETYWKSISLPAPELSIKPSMASSTLHAPSAATSPSNASVTSPRDAKMISSITGNYIHAVVQLTRDGHPVIYSRRYIPDDHFELAVQDITLSQFVACAKRQSRWVEVLPVGRGRLSDVDMTTLEILMKILGPQDGVCLDVAVASVSRRVTTSSVNELADAVLRTIYHALDGAGRRRIVMTSFSPDICAALNWKQPNYPIFFSSLCSSGSISHIRSANIDDDSGSATIAAAVDYAKSNNMLGVLLDAELLAQVPSVISGIKAAGLLVGTFGQPQHIAALLSTVQLDAVLGDGVLGCLEQSTRTSL